MKLKNKKFPFLAVQIIDKTSGFESFKVWRVIRKISHFYIAREEMLVIKEPASAKPRNVSARVIKGRQRVISQGMVERMVEPNIYDKLSIIIGSFSTTYKKP